MAMITTCPACRTRFKVTPEQLEAHGGDVRCGRCAKIFLAHNYLEQLPEATEPEEPLAAQPETVAEEVVPQPEEETPPHVEEQEAEEFHPPEEPPATPEEPPAEEVPPSSEEAEERRPPEETPAAETSLPEETAEEFHAPEEAPEVPSPAVPQAEPAIMEEPDLELKTPDEVTVSAQTESIEAEEEAPGIPQTEDIVLEKLEPEPDVSDETMMEAMPEEIETEELRRILPEPTEGEHLDLVLPDWKDQEKTPDETPSDEALSVESPAAAEEKPARKKFNFFWLWLLGAILLLAGLGGQGLYFFRTDLVARHPDLKPFLQSFCNVLQCEIHLPADPDFLSIEASSLEADPVQANLITLNAILRNRAKLAQEYPQLELTLTDTKDQMVARRIFSPKEYAKTADLSRGMPPNEEMTVKLYLDLGDLSAAGYRVFLFYPK